MLRGGWLITIVSPYLVTRFALRNLEVKKTLLKQNQDQMEMRVQRPLSKNMVQLGTLGHRRRLQMEQLPGWGWGLLKLPGPGGGGGALVVAGSSCPYLAFLSRLGIAQQTRDRHISSVTREPGSWPHPRPDELDV